MADYDLLLRDPKTLALLGILPEYVEVSWTRTALKSGRFSLTVHEDQAPSSLYPRNTLLEVRRDGAFEFAGIMAKRDYDAIDRRWTLSGPDLKGFFLPLREINPGASEFDAQAGVAAQTAMNHYVNDHLVAPADATRKIDDELTGITFTVAAGTLGNTVDYSARWHRLLDALVDIGGQGNVRHDVVLKDNYTGYEYRVYDPVNAVEGQTIAVVFSVGFDNVGEAIYLEDTLPLTNAVYVLGPGTGATRTVLEVKDTASISSDFRRESHIDSRQADTAAKRTEEGNRAIALTKALVQAASMQPLTVANEQYRTHYDVGHDVSVAFRDIGVTVNRRIVALTVSLVRQQESIQVAFEAEPKTFERLLAETIRRTQRAQVA